MSSPLLEVRGLGVRFEGRGDGARLVDAVRDVSFSVEAGEKIALVGASGSGKSTLVAALLRRIEPTEGSVRFRGVELAGLDRRELARVWPRLQLVPQDPGRSLTPRVATVDLVAEPMAVHLRLGRRESRCRAAELLVELGLAPELHDRFAHQLSGGERQRVAIARALSCEPDLLIADEPFAALDLAQAARLAALFARLVDERGATLLLVTHDLRLVARVTRRWLVLEGGRLVDDGPAARLLRAPESAATRRLVEAILWAPEGADEELD